MLLDRIEKTGDIKQISPSEYEQLAREIRSFLLEKTSKTGGHLSANLGVVELTMALHLSLDLPKDKIVWDVGHQCYTHKILTGRKDAFDNLRKFGGLSGFPKRHESDCDSFGTGHSSTSVSAALGLCVARDLKGEDHSVVAVIGDGALSGGMAYEAINNAAERKTNLIIVLNDNNQSISPSVGGMSKSLAKLRTSSAYNDIKTNIASGINSIPKVGSGIYHTISNTKKTIKQGVLKQGMLFEELGLTYLGPFDGHNVPVMVNAINQAKKVKGPVLVHVLTKKGKGYFPAEKNPAKYHGIGCFDVKSGKEDAKDRIDYTAVFSNALLKLAASDERIVAITAAMADGTGLYEFSKEYPERFFDVGIAEEHAVTFAAGLAGAGMRPVVAIYSSFLQRAYDQILHDVCIQDLPVIFAIDRAGISGPDGETHQGIYDLSYLSSIPNLTILAPKNRWELEDALEFAVSYDHPIAIRYPKGFAYEGLDECRRPIETGKAEIIHFGGDVALLAVGSMVKTAEEVYEELAKKDISAGVYNMRFVSPIDYETVFSAATGSKLVVTLEENISSGGFGEHIAAYCCKNGLKTPVINISLPDAYICQGSSAQLKKLYGLDAESITKRILKEFDSGNKS
ncbi:MAG: 1-deoxy-D-xylulose-5-phosphate synthase [Lachnospiraceae bacterium]|nr:1-deoxy-D-xylulose-5-phosphate synthase [Lachnospiraceae bacterium]